MKVKSDAFTVQTQIHRWMYCQETLFTDVSLSATMSSIILVYYFDFHKTFSTDIQEGRTGRRVVQWIEHWRSDQGRLVWLKLKRDFSRCVALGYSVR